jgi:hypothetical protein
MRPAVGGRAGAHDDLARDGALRASHGGNMTDPTRALTLQLLEWIADEPRSYDEALATWRTNCPRLSIWEDACIDGLIDCEPGTRLVSVSAKGRQLLSAP